MLDFDANEGFIDRRAHSADALVYPDFSTLGRHQGMTPRHDRLLGSPS